jgi:DNA-binding HxlR family transcriptional regulator
MTYVPKRAPLDPCPVETAFAIVGGKWKARIILLLSLQPFRFVELRRALPGVTQQVLSAQLKTLRKDGIVSRQNAALKRTTVPTYSPSNDGERLVKALEECVIRWDITYLGRT